MKLNVFALHSESRKRSFLLYDKLEDHANEVHDYLKHLKFGYGRAMTLVWKFDMGI